MCNNFGTSLKLPIPRCPGIKISGKGEYILITTLGLHRCSGFIRRPYNAPNLQCVPLCFGLQLIPLRRGRYFVILEGSATITFPTSDEILHVKPNQLYIAADTPKTSELGHITTVRAGSRILQFPYQDGAIPEHTATAGECAETTMTTGRNDTELFMDLFEQ